MTVAIEGDVVGTSNCSCYWPGHNLHWIPVLRVWVPEPRLPMSIEALEDVSFLITAQGQTAVYYTHAPEQTRRLIKKFKPEAWKLVGKTGAVQIEDQKGHGWVYFSKEKVNNCEVNLCECKASKYLSLRKINQELDEISYRASFIRKI